ALFVYFLCSNVTVVQPGEVALVLRLGKLVGANRDEQVRQPGLLLAFPYPIDQVLRVPVKQEGEGLITGFSKPPSQGAAEDAIDSQQEGYCLTADQNIVQALLVARYRITDPVAFTLQTDRPQALLRNATVAAVTQTVNGWRVDDALRLRRER